VTVLIIAGWNILRASVCAKIREIAWARAGMAVMVRFLPYRREFEKFSKLGTAARANF
jgi:hypothetical protein